ncbi:WxL domain-containing protein [Dellaglioa sp. P0083]|uniref:WxL domain-containing protein n=1 Tax=Dellaglioa kimchii TaxID=3344667 RepID=UPI0038D3E309
MKNVLTSALLSATILGAGLAVSGSVNAADMTPASTATGVQFKAGDEGQVIPPVDPTDPTNPTDPGDNGNTGNSGNLAIIYATKAISFGTENEITANTVNLTSDKDVAVEVGDVRGTNAGWTLAVSSKQLANADESEKLDGAAISLGAGAVSVGNGSTAKHAVSSAIGDTTTSGVVLGATAGAGAGINVDNIKNTDVKLTIPAGVAKADIAYASTLTWTLSDTPAV